LRAILLSIEPKWAAKIYSHKKIVEVRKTEPHRDKIAYSEDAPAMVYMYETGTGLVTGCFFMPGVIRARQAAYLAQLAGMGLKELTDYGPGRDGRYHGWMVTAPSRFVTPYHLSAFGLKHPPQSWCYTDGPRR